MRRPRPEVGLLRLKKTRLRQLYYKTLCSIFISRGLERLISKSPAPGFTASELPLCFFLLPSHLSTLFMLLRLEE